MASKIELYPHQRAALEKLFSGAILCGGTGSGKSYTALFFYKQRFRDRPLYIITTAKKRDEGDWIREARKSGIYDLTVDSWNNIKKYKDVKHSFFIFDEQRVVGYGAWARTFIRIAKQNHWILATATPGDNWSDYIPVFIANGFYSNKTEFTDRHIEFHPFTNFPKIKRYHEVDVLTKYRDRILVMMPDERHTIRNRKIVSVGYDKDLYLSTMKNRWNPYSDTPIKNASEYLHTIRRVLSESQNRQWYANYIISLYSRIIVFYNYDYELETLKEICESQGRDYYQWNGYKHEYLPEEGDWVYLTQYMAGSEGWNCTSTNATLFYSLNYSYRMMAQAEGRTDRIDTPFVELDYYYLLAKSTVDNAIYGAIKRKKKFNETAWSKRKWES